MAMLHRADEDREGWRRPRPVVNDLSLRHTQPRSSGSPEWRRLLPVRRQRGTVTAPVRSIAAERIVYLFPRVFHPARPSTLMTDENRPRPTLGTTRDGYAPRYQPRSLVPSRTAQSARSARSSPRTAGGG